MSTGRPASPLARGAVTLLMLWTAAVTILRAIRWPNDFAEAHWLLDYRFGFIRRGLLGEILRRVVNPFGAPVTEGAIAVAAAIAFALLCVALAFVAWRILRRSGWAPDAVLVLLAFLCSPFVVMGAHFIGYLDHPVLVLTVVATALLLRGRVIPAALLQAAAVLVHESSVVVGAPAWGLCLWLAARRAGSIQARRLWPAVLPLAAFLLVAVADRAQHDDGFSERLSRRLARAEFVGGDMHVFVPEWLSESFAENYAVHSRHFESRITSAPMYGLMLPAVLALFCVAVDRFHPRPVDAVLTIGVIVAPLALHLAAFDTARIWSFTVVAALLALWVLAETHAPRVEGSAAVRVVAAAAMLSNVLVTSPLMDGLSERFSLLARLALYAPLAAGMAFLPFRSEPDTEPVTR